MDSASDFSASLKVFCSVSTSVKKTKAVDQEEFSNKLCACFSLILLHLEVPGKESGGFLLFCG